MGTHLSQTQYLERNRDQPQTTSCLSFPGCKMTRTECLFPAPPVSSVQGVNGDGGRGSITALGEWALAG